MRSRLLIDMDGVIVDLMGEAVARGLFAHPPCRWDFTGCCTHLSQDEVFAGDIFIMARPISGAVDGVNQLLNDGFDVRFVSTPWLTNHDSAKNKYEWIGDYFGDPRRLTLAHDKTLIPAAALIDDRPGLVGPWVHVEYPQAWNSQREPSWDDGLADLIGRRYS